MCIHVLFLFILKLSSPIFPLSLLWFPFFLKPLFLLSNYDSCYISSSS